MEFTVLIGGEAGQGMFSVELELTELLSRLGYHFFATKNYMSRIRGGNNYHMVRVADRPVHALSGRPWDKVIAMDGGETERRHRPSLGKGGVFIGADRVGQIEKVNTYPWYRERIYRLEEPLRDRLEAIRTAQTWGERIPIGVFWRDEGYNCREGKEMFRKPVTEDAVARLLNRSCIMMR